MDNIGLNCKYCNKECKNINSLIQHEIRCKDNPNRKLSRLSPICMKGHPSYGNQFTKAKLEGKEYIVSDETKLKLSKANKGRKWSDEDKKRISESCKKYYSEHPDKISFKLYHSSKKSYPEQYFEELFIKENINLKYHLRVDRYELDFYNSDVKKYVEIDGEQHFSDKMIKHDNVRTNYLKELGWEGIRICWRKYKKLSVEERHNVIENIRNFITTDSSYISQAKIERIYISYKNKKDIERKIKSEIYHKKQSENYKIKRNAIKLCCETSNINFTKFGWSEKMKLWILNNTGILFNNMLKSICRFYPEFIDIYKPFFRKSIKSINSSLAE